MPIYAYRCAACGHAQDVLQRLSDAVLTLCPACGAAAYAKQPTAAGFQLKGSGWYVTDFRDGKGGKKPAAEPEAGAAAPAEKPADAAKEAVTDAAAAKAAEPASGAASVAAPAPAPAAAAPPPGSSGG